MTDVVFHRLAKKEARAANRWYAARNPDAATRFRAAVEAAAQRIANDPDSYAVLVGEFRYLRVQRFPYILIYRRQDENSVLIVAVAHTSHRPGYWRRRK